MKGNDIIWGLVRVGASVAANCTACLEYHAGKARDSGVDEKLIDRAIKTGMLVRNAAVSGFDKTTMELTTADADAPADGEDPGCGCC